MREKLARFMQGRYGIDELGRFMTGASLAIVILELITGWYALTLVFWAIFIVIYYRMFSRDYGKRQQENQKFLTARYKFKAKWYQTFHKNNNSYGKTGGFQKFQKDMQQRMQYHIYKCPSCSQKIRIPRGKGKIMVRCPKCKTEFMKRS
ncbi:MAG: hypothetical protein IJO85_11690 [Lachnospiraceae bacterium]|nr:hypothetical protein [Lachnospiraceae bacterium]